MTPQCRRQKRQEDDKEHSTKGDKDDDNTKYDTQTGTREGRLASWRELFRPRGIGLPG